MIAASRAASPNRKEALRILKEVEEGVARLALEASSGSTAGSVLGDQETLNEQAEVKRELEAMAEAETMMDQLSDAYGG